jgi:hypothetical protein
LRLNLLLVWWLRLLRRLLLNLLLNRLCRLLTAFRSWLRHQKRRIAGNLT